MEARDRVDVAIEEDPREPCLWAPSEWWPDFVAAGGQPPKVVSEVIYRGKTVGECGAPTNITTQSF